MNNPPNPDTRLPFGPFDRRIRFSAVSGEPNVTGEEGILITPTPLAIADTGLWVVVLLDGEKAPRMFRPEHLDVAHRVWEPLMQPRRPKKIIRPW